MLKRRAAWIKKCIYMISVAALLLAGLGACSQDSSTSASTTTTAPGGPPITIGYSYPVSGDFASDGKAEDQGYQLWANTVNNNGGILGRPIQLVKLTDNSTPEQITKNYTTLITKDHVDLLLGPYSSLLTKAAAPVAHQYGYALLEGSGGAPSVFQLNTDWKSNTVFDVSLPVVQNLDSFAYYILSLPPNQRPKTVAYATEDTDPFTKPQVDRAVQLLTQQGGIKQVAYITDGGTPKEFPTVARELIQANADIDVVGTFLPDIATFIKTFKQAHYFPKALAATAGPGDGQPFIKAVGLSAAEGVFVPNGWYPQADNFQNAQMVQDYLAQYGGTADGINADVAEAYSAGQVLEQAIEKIGKVNNATLISELQKDTFDTVQGAVTFRDANPPGSNSSALPYLFQWQKGSLLPVFPPIVAVQNPVYPNPQAS